MKGINLEEKLNGNRQKRVLKDGDALLEAFKTLYREDDILDEEILSIILKSNEHLTSLDASRLNAKYVYHENDIKKLCTIYRLRFLDGRYFKGDIPYEAVAKVKQLQKTSEASISSFKIMAPAKMFSLRERDKDPLLFIPVGDQHYYLVHKWGRDLSFFRKIMVFPFRNFKTLLFSVALLAFLVVISIPESFVVGNSDMPSWPYRGIVFFYFFLAFSGLTALYGFSRMKNFNNALWDSRYTD